jgi:uncharacterized membrane protein HdeD (DUF308 family)
MSQLLVTSPASPPYDEHASMRPLWGLFLVLGLVSVVVGFLAIGSAFIATLATCSPSESCC